MLVSSAACAVALLLLLAGQIFLILGARSSAKDVRVSVQQLDQRLRSINAEQARLEQTLRRPENASVLERSVLLNSLVQRKSISWTKIFADLESVTPENVRLIQIRLPQITTQQEVLLDMTVGSQEAQPLIDFVKRLQDSPLFGSVNVHSTAPPSQNQPLYQYRLSVNYAQKL
jgi:Tfp pilus assembly protein PilN